MVQKEAIFGRFVLALVFWLGMSPFFLGGVFKVSLAAQDATTQQQQEALQQQLQQVEQQIAQYQKELMGIQGEKKTLQNKLSALQHQQTILTLQVRATTLQIDDLAKQISETEAAIAENEKHMEGLRGEMVTLLQIIAQRDDTPILYTLFLNERFSDVLADAERDAQLSQGLKELLDATKQENDALAKASDALAQQQEDAQNLLSVQTIQQQGVADFAAQQNALLAQTKGKESNYQNILNNATQQANAIRSRLYQLLQVQNQLTFGQALEIAQWASGYSGVRPAFLLAILTQESNLGRNVGTCNRPGDPPSKSWRAVMHPTRDQPPFLQITQELGLDPDTTPVSCPMHAADGTQIGWGGAMGPAQFIPSTWMGYRARVSAITGKPANPWDIRDAFLAAAIKLAAGGATTQDGEWAAAMRYFSGSTNARYRFYGDNVVALAAQYQEDIDALGQ